MLGKIAAHVRQNVIAYLALFVALGPSAYATHEMIDSSDVVDGSLRGEDIQNQTLTGADFAAQSLGTTRIRDDNLLSVDIKDDALTGADIDESTVHHVRARVRGGPITLPGCPQGQCESEVALTGNTWTQRADEFDRVEGEVRATIPCAGATTVLSITRFLVDGEEMPALGNVRPFPSAQPQTGFFLLPSLVEPGTDTPHTLTMRVLHPCTVSSTIDSIKLDVIGAS